jgi:uncharacterized protein
MSEGRKFGRRWLPLAIGAAAAAWVYATIVERAQVRLSRYECCVPFAGLPPSGLSILLLSDLHFRAHDTVQDLKVSRLIRLLRGEKYDIVAHTGDLIHDAGGMHAATAFLAGLRPQIGAYACLGNHDYCETTVWGLFEVPDGVKGFAALVTIAHSCANFVRQVATNERVYHPKAHNDINQLLGALRGCGVLPLVNENIHLTGPDLDVWVAGVDDYSEGKPDVARALDGIPEDGCVILLAHNPDGWLDQAADCVALTLAGHTHGGQVALPGVFALHTQGTHLSRRKAAGWFQRGRARLFVSRGVGESVPLRLGAPPEAVLIRLRTGEEGR